MFLMTAAIAEAPTRLDPIKLFLDADIVVQAVMLGLLAASVWSWMIIVSFSMRTAAANRRAQQFESEFWKADDYESTLKTSAAADSPAGRVVRAALGEWRRSRKAGVKDNEATHARVVTAMDGQVAEEADTMASRLNFLATLGSVAPFVGLFGTVWGIMNSFFQIGSQESSSLAVVAPGISEALFATAIGLFAAIPAVIAYNRFSHRVNLFEARLTRFADRFAAELGRDMEHG
ncbi:protein TolQ [Erythrobacter sp. LQ02-29]|uniref:protein TolQ n=1 Tax=Erythrobacter sp. LQ02-29 TaxID=2920384 RepID=UPI001F4DFB5C|nr:protein TolQ [Erythrobacter sp. LQ02-29]MCP9222178.1 protein TolQ [Erythrobacter sp. LQ02-29]